MQLTITTDYAIRIVLYLAEHKGISASSEISAETGVTQQYVVRIMNRLKRKKLVAGHAGQYGGYSLAKPPEAISLLDILNAMEKTMQINYCIAKGARCSQGISQTCPVKKAFEQAQEAFERKLGEITVAQLSANEVKIRI